MNNDDINNTISSTDNDNNNVNNINLPNNNQNNEKEISINNEKDTEQTIFTNFNEPCKIGLQNVGATCYMNATVQCLCQIEKLVNYFKYKPNSIFQAITKNKLTYKNTLTYSFKYLIENLWH